MSGHHLTQKQKFEMGTLLTKHCFKMADGVAAYEMGWDDARVAKEMGSEFNSTHVRNLRRELVGNLKTKSHEPKENSVAARLLRIEEYLTSKNANWKEQV